jgi:hypothetical protein
MSQQPYAIPIIAAGALVAFSIWITAPKDRYLIAAGDNLAWRVEKRTGKISVCKIANFEVAPICSPFGDNSLESAKAEYSALKAFKAEMRELDKELADLPSEETPAKP